MTDNKNITYLNKSFSDFKGSLSNFAQTYFPNTYNDFGDASTGMMFIEMASYVGDVLSFYLDTQFQENLLLYTKEKDNIISIAYALGYRPKMSYASIATVDIYQLVPIQIVNGVSTPDWDYGLVFPENTVLLSASTNQKFLTREKVDFSIGDGEVNSYDNSYFIVRKSVKVVAGEIKTATFNFTSPVKFNSITINDSNILQVLSVVDSSNDNWYEVPYLAQETIIEQINNPNASADGISYLFNYKKVPKRFITRFQSNGSLKIQFGAGTSTKTDDVILPTPDNIQLGLVPTVSNLEDNYNKAAIFFAREYGVAPSNTTLTISYIVGGGIGSNVSTNDITKFNSSLNSSNFASNILSNDPYYSVILGNVIVTNSSPATGGRDGDTVEEIRLNTLNSFSAQDRAVTKEDYAVRALSMPSYYGSIAKAYTTQDLISTNNGNNPLALSLYILAYDSNKRLQTASLTLKENLKSYISQYRMATDAIDIKNAFIINILVNFDITVIPGFNNREILSNCNLALQSYFNIDKMQINKPILLSEVYASLLKIRGVQSVLKIDISNVQGNSYSQYGYDIKGATRNNIIYPSLDPSIFEVKYPSADIAGRIVAL